MICEEGQLADAEGEVEAAIDATDRCLIREDDLRCLGCASRKSHEEDANERRIEEGDEHGVEVYDDREANASVKVRRGPLVAGKL